MEKQTTQKPKDKQLKKFSLGIKQQSLTHLFYFVYMYIPQDLYPVT